MALRVSSERVRDVRFAEQWRGYRTQEVDEFVEQVADALDHLEGRLEEAAERAALAERRLSERGPDESLQRTLVLAQRTADAALEEAKVEAARTVADAEERARAVLEHLEGRRADIEGEIETRMSAELAEVSERRMALESDLELLASYVERSRERLIQDLRAQLQWLERAEPIESMPAVRPPLDPPVPGRPGDAIAAPVMADPDDRGPGPGRAVTAVVADDDATETDVSDRRPQPRAAVSDAVGGAAPGGAAPSGDTPDGTASSDTTSSDRAPADDTVLDDLDVIPWDDVAEEEDDAGADDPLVSGESQADDDPFIAELRRAVDDPEPLGPRDEAVERGDVERGDLEWSDDVDLFDRRQGDSMRSRRRRK